MVLWAEETQGKVVGNGKALTKTYEEWRNVGKEDFENLDAERYAAFDLEFPDGHGKQNPLTFKVVSRTGKERDEHVLARQLAGRNSHSIQITRI